MSWANGEPCVAVSFEGGKESSPDPHKSALQEEILEGIDQTGMERGI